MYASVASDVIIGSQKKGYPITKTIARAELAKEYIDFLKERLPEITWQFSASFGSMFAIFFYDWRIAIVCSIIILPIVLVNRVYRKNVVQQQKNLHDNKEDMYQVLASQDTSKIQNYYFRMVLPQIKIARWNSIDYTVIKILLMVIFVVVLFICVDVDNFTTGKIYSIVAYLWTFIASTEYLPGLMESMSSVNELNIRLGEEA
jgi:ABC-type multidrug transport system fused ATPase/permease subunit